VKCPVAVTRTDASGNTVLHYAIRKKPYDVIKFFILKKYPKAAKEKDKDGFLLMPFWKVLPSEIKIMACFQ
jgi:ankyrin repeat protein